VRHVVAIDIAEERLAHARRMGAHATINPAKENLQDRLAELHGSAQAISGSPTVGTDVFYNLAGAPGIIDQISGLAKFRSRLVVGAIYLNPVPLNFRVLMLREIEMTTVGPCQQDLRDVLAELPEIDPAVLDAYVTGTFPFSEFDNAFAIAKQTSSAKVMITFAPADA